MRLDDPDPKQAPGAATAQPTALSKHSLLIAGHPTSVSLEAAFWTALKRMAAARKTSVAALVADIDATRGDANLSSSIRVFLLQAASAAAGQGEG